MPELPEVETVVRELSKKLKNRRIGRVLVKASKMVHIGPKVISNLRTEDTKVVKIFQKMLKGLRVFGVKRRAKLIIFEFRQTFPSPSLVRRGENSLFLLVHLKMTGQFIFEDKKLFAKTNGYYRLLNKKTAPLVKLPGKHTHVVFKFTDGSTLYFNDVRKFGYLKLTSAANLSELSDLKHFGPEPLESSFTMDLFTSEVERAKKFRKKISVKQLLMEPAFVAGIGNIYSDEILFHAGLGPSRKVSTLKTKEIQKIYRNIKPVLLKGIQAKGSSVGDFVRTDGSWGKMGKHHFVYGRKGQPCKKCGSIILSKKLGGRTASFCPNCQK